MSKRALLFAISSIGVLCASSSVIGPSIAIIMQFCEERCEFWFWFSEGYMRFVCHVNVADAAAHIFQEGCRFVWFPARGTNQTLFPFLPSSMTLEHLFKLLNVFAKTRRSVRKILQSQLDAQLFREGLDFIIENFI